MRSCSRWVSLQPKSPSLLLLKLGSWHQLLTESGYGTGGDDTAICKQPRACCQRVMSIHQPPVIELVALRAVVLAARLAFDSIARWLGWSSTWWEVAC